MHPCGTALHIRARLPGSPHTVLVIGQIGKNLRSICPSLLPSCGGTATMSLPNQPIERIAGLVPGCDDSMITFL